MKRALVTGGAGFIGSNLTTELLSRGWEVCVFDNLSRIGSDKNLKWLRRNDRSKKLKIETKDIRDYRAVEKAIKKVDVVFHLAAQTAVTTSLADPREDFEVNVLGSLNILEAARKSAHKPIVVYSSTNKVYGAMEDIKLRKGKRRYSYKDFPEGIDEAFPLDFHSPYGCSKGAADQYTRDYFRIYDLPTVVFRQSCIYGPRQMGVEDQGWVAHFAISARFGRPITIYGDGKQVRDLLYIDDLIEAYLKAVDRIDKVAGEVFNIGGGKENSLSIIEFVEHLKKKLNKKIKIKYSGSRPGDQKVFISNNAKAEDKLKWEIKAQYKEGIQKLLEWINENKTLF